AFMYLGTMNGLSPSAAWTAESNQISAYFGRSVASAGDVNGDGFGDVIVGVYRYDNAEDDEGAAFMYLGTMNGLSPSAAWTVESNQISAYFGWSVASAGDVNGDGFGDVVVGSPYYYNGEINEGVVGVYDLTPPLAPFTPSGSYNITQHLVGSRSDLSTLIPTCGLSDRRDSFKLEVKINNAAVNAPLQLEWEVKANGEKFDDMTTTVVTVNNADGLGSATISETITGLQADTAYRWRARVLENGVAGPWLRILNHDVQGCDIRTRAEADIALTVNAPNNVGVNHEFDAVFSIANTVGPDRAPSVVFNTWYYPKTLPILGVVADSGGSCEIQNLLDQNQSIILSRVGCNFPNIPFGTTAKVTLRLKGTQEPASHQLGATVSHVGYEPDTTNNTVSSMVNILPTLALKVVPSPSLTSLTTFENDQIDNFTVQLTSPPDGNVYVTLNSIPAEEAQVFPTQMQFDSTNWDTPLPVTVRGVRDAVSDGNASFAITLVAKADPDKATDTEQLAAAGDVTVNGDNNDVLAMTITDTGLSIPHARAPGYGATITGTSATLTWDKVVHPQEDPVSFNIYLCTDSALAPTSCQTINPVVQASLMPLWITAGAGGSGILFIGFMATRPRKRWLVVAGMIAIGTTLVSCGGSSGSSLPPSAPPAADTMGTTVTGLSAGTYYWRVEAYDPGNGGIPRVSSEVMIFTVQ
ncbi:MAG: integrin alpha, partial [Gammaproteobacteria bacterium]